jgi:hypothetical protein
MGKDGWVKPTALTNPDQAIFVVWTPEFWWPLEAGGEFYSKGLTLLSLS